MIYEDGSIAQRDERREVKWCGFVQGGNRWGLADFRVLDERLDTAEAQRKPEANITVPARCSH